MEEFSEQINAKLTKIDELLEGIDTKTNNLNAEVNILKAKINRIHVNDGKLIELMEDEHQNVQQLVIQETKRMKLTLEEEIENLKIFMTLEMDKLKSPKNVEAAVYKLSPCNFSWKIKKMTEKLKARDEERAVEIEEFLIYDYMVRAEAKLKISVNGLEISVDVKDEPDLHNVFPSVTYILKHVQNNNEEKFDIIATSSYLHGMVDNFTGSSNGMTLCDLDTTRSYIDPEDDSIVIEIIVEPPSHANSSFSDDGILVVKIDNYAKNIEREINHCHYCVESPYFYTSSNGYRVQMAIYLNGLNNYSGIGMSAEVVFLAGKHDKPLNDIVSFRVTFILINQVDYQKSWKVRCEIQERNLSCGKPTTFDVILHRDIMNGGFLKDDALYYNAIIQDPQG